MPKLSKANSGAAGHHLGILRHLQKLVYHRAQITDPTAAAGASGLMGDPMDIPEIAGLARIRGDLQLPRQYAYLNSAGTSYPAASVLDSVFAKIRANADDTCRNGNDLEVDAEKQWVQSASRFIHADPGEVTGITSTAHGLGQILYGLDLQPGHNIVTSDLEYAGVQVVLTDQVRRTGCEMRYARRDGWRIPVERFADLVDANTRAILVSHVEFVNGYRHNLRALADIAHQAGAILIADTIQSLGMFDVDVRALGIDAMAAGSYKWMGALHGYGLMYIRKNLVPALRIPFGSLAGVMDAATPVADFIQSMDFMRDYPVDETSIRKFAPATDNLVGKLCLAGMMDLLYEIGLDRIEQKILALRQYLVEQLQARQIPLQSDDDPATRSGIVNFCPPEPPEEFVRRAAAEKIIIAPRGGGVRVAMHFYNTTDELDQLLALL